MPDNQTEEAKKYEVLGRMLVQLHESGVMPGKHFYRHAFLKGMVGGLGGVIGATILIALLLWILSFFDSIPFVGGIVDTIRNTITKS